MLKIIESVSGPIRYIITKNTKFNPGSIIQLKEINDTPTCVLCDGTKPFGVVDFIDEKYNLALVYFDTMVIQTDQFEKRNEMYENYVAGARLYASRNGKFSTKKANEGSILLGHVISGPDYDKAWLELSWI